MELDAALASSFSAGLILVAGNVFASKDLFDALFVASIEVLDISVFRFRTSCLINQHDAVEAASNML